jgi:glycosyltransferase involved in cell wall biosynthesis
MYLKGRPLYAGPYFVWTLSAIARSHTILTDSRSSATDLRQLFRRRSVVANPVFYEEIVTGTNGAPDEEPALPAPGTRFVLYNGGLDPRKNVTVLLEGFRIVMEKDPELRLVLMGKGYDQLSDQYEALGIASNVVLTGYVSDAEKLAIMKRATALVYPSLYEGFGLPLFEAFAHRVPVVTSAGSSLGEVAGDAAVFVDPDDPRSIADGIAQVQDPEVRERLREAGTARWEAYDPAATRQVVIDTILSTLNGGRPAAWAG